MPPLDDELHRPDAGGVNEGPEELDEMLLERRVCPSENDDAFDDDLRVVSVVPFGRVGERRGKGWSDTRLDVV